MFVTPLGRSKSWTSCEGEPIHRLRSNNIQVVCPLISGDSLLELLRSWKISAEEWLIFSIANFSFFSIIRFLLRVYFCYCVKCFHLLLTLLTLYFLLVTNFFNTLLVVVKRRCQRPQVGVGLNIARKGRQLLKKGCGIDCQGTTKHLEFISKSFITRQSSLAHVRSSAALGLYIRVDLE